jgi:hypothetical protein
MPLCRYGLSTHFWFFDAVIQVSFDQIVFDQKTLDHIANSVNKTFDLLTNWLRFVSFVQNTWSHFADSVANTLLVYWCCHPNVFQPNFS